MIMITIAGLVKKHEHCIVDLVLDLVDIRFDKTG